jgi:TRAP-type C4-dicarboxylate transport system permease small subunit
MIRKIIDAVDRLMSFFEDWTLFVSIMVALVAMFANVVMRYGFHHSLAWSEELVRDVIIYTTFIGCSAAIKNRSMIKIDATVQIFPFLLSPLSWFSNVITLIFSTMMMWYGFKMAQLQYITHQKSIIMQIPLVYLYVILPLTGLMMFVRTLIVMYQDAVGEPDDGNGQGPGQADQLQGLNGNTTNDDQ